MSLLNAFCDQVGISFENLTLIQELSAAKERLQQQLEQTNQELEQVKEILKVDTEVYQTKYAYKNIISQSRAMKDVFRILDKVTETDLAVFLYGESGTGKELFARALHYNNPHRMHQRFVAINCGAIPAELMESELFGHKMGSFTGAKSDKKGLFEEADGGTIFLDEIGELAPHLQVKLLRILQEGEIQRIGETKTVKVNVRVVSASHKSLEDLVKQKMFRDDLYYRLCQIKIDLPPLRQRIEDIPILVAHFVNTFRQKNNISDPIEIQPDFMKSVMNYEWPGNIRELENFVSVACALRDQNKLCLENLPDNYKIKSQQQNFTDHSLSKNYSVLQTTKQVVQEAQIFIDSQNIFDVGLSWQAYENLIITSAYLHCGRKKMDAAQALGLSHSKVYKKINELNLDTDKEALTSVNFIYSNGYTLKDYVRLVFAASLQYHNQHPYAAIKQLGVSQGYFYKILKTITSKEITSL